MSFQFVNIATPDQSISAKSRSHVMRNYLDGKRSKIDHESKLQASSEQNRTRSRATKMKQLSGLLQTSGNPRPGSSDTVVRPRATRQQPNSAPSNNNGSWQYHHAIRVLRDYLNVDRGDPTALRKAH